MLSLECFVWNHIKKSGTHWNNVVFLRHVMEMNLSCQSYQHFCHTVTNSLKSNRLIMKGFMKNISAGEYVITNVDFPTFMPQHAKILSLRCCLINKTNTNGLHLVFLCSYQTFSDVIHTHQEHNVWHCEVFDRYPSLQREWQEKPLDPNIGDGVGRYWSTDARFIGSRGSVPRQNFQFGGNRHCSHIYERHWQTIFGGISVC